MLAEFLSPYVAIMCPLHYAKLNIVGHVISHMIRNIALYVGEFISIMCLSLAL